MRARDLPGDLLQNVAMASHLIPDDNAPKPSAPLKDALKRPLHDLRISLLDRCNFRCPYCMPENEFHDGYEFLTKRDRLTHEEILHVARVATGLGVSKLRLTGGEPLLDKQVPSPVEQLAVLPGVDDLAMTPDCTGSRSASTVSTSTSSRR